MINLITTEKFVGINNDFKTMYDIMVKEREHSVRFSTNRVLQTYIVVENNFVLLVGYRREEASEQSVIEDSFTLKTVILMDLTIKNNAKFFRKVLHPAAIHLSLDIRKRLSVLTNVVDYLITQFALEKNKVTCSIYKKPFSEKPDFIFVEGKSISKEENYE